MFKSEFSIFAYNEKNHFFVPIFYRGLKHKNVGGFKI